MKLTTALVALSTIVSAGSATAATITYADSISWTNNGTVGTSNNRNEPTNALGAPDGEFLSLGLGGEATFGFERDFSGGGRVFEVTFGNVTNYLETADVYVSSDNVSFTKVASVDNQDQANGANFSFTGVWSFLKLVDTSSNPPSPDGFDVDAIGVAPVPVPAAFPLLLGGLGAAGLIARRKKKAS